MPVVKATRQDWIDAGLELYAAGGRAAINVERLAATVGAAKAGFYWHFTDRSTFLTALIEHWYGETTERLAVEAPSDDFARAVFGSRRYVDVEGQLRREASHDAEIARLLGTVDARRRSHIAAVLQADGLPSEDPLPEVLYDQFLGWAGRMRAPSPADIERQVRVARLIAERFGSP